MCSHDDSSPVGRNKPLELLEREITELASHIHAATCRWLGLVAEFDRREGWADWGCRSCAHWVSWRCGIAPVAAREHVRVARRLESLPLVRSAFAGGPAELLEGARAHASGGGRARGGPALAG